MRAWAVVAVAAVLVAAAGVVRSQRSPKKGMVIPNWPAHYCRDWDNMEEHIRLKHQNIHFHISTEHRL